MENKEEEKIFENAGKTIIWMNNHTEWKWDENGFAVLLTNNAPDFVKDTFERMNRGTAERNKQNALEDKLEGNN